MSGTLIIVPCGQGKIWDQDPGRGALPAKDVYTGAPFKVNRAYAERFADCWVILSAKYGFIFPDAQIPGPYNVTFKKRASQPVSVSVLRKQVRELGLDQYEIVIGLGGKEYRSAIEQAFAAAPGSPVFPFAGLPLGRAMQAVKRAVEQGVPLAHESL